MANQLYSIPAKALSQGPNKSQNNAVQTMPYSRGTQAYDGYHNYRVKGMPRLMDRHSPLA